MIGEVAILEYGEGSKAMTNHLRTNKNYNWVSELPLNIEASLYGAMMAREHRLANVGSYVAFSDKSD